MSGKIRLLCTVGPSSMDPRTIRRLEEAGVDLFRINLSHTPLEPLRDIIKTLRRWTEVPICLDTEGAQVRTGRLPSKEMTLQEGARVLLVCGETAGDVPAGAVPLTPAVVFDQLAAGDLISIDFHSVLLAVESVVPGRSAEAVVLAGGRIGTNKACNVDRAIRLPTLSPKDREAVAIGIEEGVRHFALSFCSRAADVAELRALAGKPVTIVSKVESLDALRELKAILEASDAILIDRGDLSREVPLVRIPIAQKEILGAARACGKPAFVATNLLESMIEHRRPTRAEVNDVINTLLDGASGLVLAAETAIGSHPVACAEMIAGLIREFKAAGPGSGILERSCADHNRANLALPPHGGVLRGPSVDSGRPHDEVLRPGARALIDAERLAVGLYSPLRGFMSEAEHRVVLAERRLPSGEYWPVPVALRLPKGRDARPGERLALEDDRGRMSVVLDVESVYSLGDGRFAAGPVSLFKGTAAAHTPAQKTRLVLEHKGWTKVLGRGADAAGPAMDGWDSVLILDAAAGPSPAVVGGELRVGFPSVSDESEALLRAVCLKNYGCSHVVAGEDATALRDGVAALGLRAVAPSGRHGGAAVIWLTGLSGAGKSTLGEALADWLRANGRRARVLDGDALRAGAHRDLGFSREDILENGRRMARLCAELSGEHDYLIVSMISPFRQTRDAAREALSPCFHEIHLDAPLEVLGKRDVKGLYAKARRGEIRLIGACEELPYEAPAKPELTLRTGQEDLGRSLETLKAYLSSHDAGLTTGLQAAAAS